MNTSDTPRTDLVLSSLRRGPSWGDKNHPLYILSAELESINGHLERELTQAHKCAASHFDEVVKLRNEVATAKMHSDWLLVELKKQAHHVAGEFGTHNWRLNSYKAALLVYNAALNQGESK